MIEWQVHYGSTWPNISTQSSDVVCKASQWTTIRLVIVMMMQSECDSQYLTLVLIWKVDTNHINIDVQWNVKILSVGNIHSLISFVEKRKTKTKNKTQLERHIMSCHMKKYIPNKWITHNPVAPLEWNAVCIHQQKVPHRRLCTSLLATNPASSD